MAATRGDAIDAHLQDVIAGAAAAVFVVCAGAYVCWLGVSMPEPRRSALGFRSTEDAPHSLGDCPRVYYTPTTSPTS